MEYMTQLPGQVGELMLVEDCFNPGMMRLVLQMIWN